MGGKERYGCGKTFLAQYTNRDNDSQVKEQNTRMVLNGSEARHTTRLLKISLITACLHFKKVVRCPG